MRTVSSQRGRLPLNVTGMDVSHAEDANGDETAVALPSLARARKILRFGLQYR